MHTQTKLSPSAAPHLTPTNSYELKERVADTTQSPPKALQGHGTNRVARSLVSSVVPAGSEYAIRYTNESTPRAWMHPLNKPSASVGSTTTVGTPLPGSPPASLRGEDVGSSLPFADLPPAFSQATQRVMQAQGLLLPRDLIARAKELLPSGEALGVLKKSGETHLNCTHETAQAINRYMAGIHAVRFGSNKDASAFATLTPESLNKLWGDGLKHGRYNQMVQDLAHLHGNEAHWRDASGCIRTIKPASSRFKRWASQNLNYKTVLTKMSIDKARNPEDNKVFIKTDGATALALLCLSRGDMENFSRVVAAEPRRIIDTLLDESKIRFGSIFSESNIWLVLAHCSVRMLAEPSTRGSTQGAVIAAIDNFLTYHAQPKVKTTSPQPAQVKSHILSKDVLVNNFDAFNAEVSKFWTNLSPRNNHILDILNISKDMLNSDIELTGILIHTFYNGLFFHLDRAIKRQHAGSIKTDTTPAMDLEVNAAEVANPSSEGPAPAAINNVADYFIERFSGKIAGLRRDNNLKQMKEIFQKLFKHIEIANAFQGNFVPGQPYLANDMLGNLSSASTDKTIIKESQRSATEAHTDAQTDTDKQYQNIDPVKLKEYYRKAMRLRAQASQHLTDFMLSL